MLEWWNIYTEEVGFHKTEQLCREMRDVLNLWCISFTQACAACRDALTCMDDLHLLMLQSSSDHNWTLQNRFYVLHVSMHALNYIDTICAVCPGEEKMTACQALPFELKTLHFCHGFSCDAERAALKITAHPKCPIQCLTGKPKGTGSNVRFKLYTVQLPLSSSFSVFFLLVCIKGLRCCFPKHVYFTYTPPIYQFLFAHSSLAIPYGVIWFEWIVDKCLGSGIISQLTWPEEEGVQGKKTRRTKNRESGKTNRKVTVQNS